MRKNAFERDSATDDTRVRTAIAWLEEAELLKREENHVQVFPSSLQVSSVEEARAKLERTSVAETYRGQLLRIAEALIEAGADEGLTTDELMGVSGLSPEGVRGALYDLERLGIASNDTVLTAFVHAGVKRGSLKRPRGGDGAGDRTESLTCEKRRRTRARETRRRCICALPRKYCETKA